MLFLTQNLTNQIELCFFSQKQNTTQPKMPKGRGKNTANYKRGTGNWKKHSALQKRGTTSPGRWRGKDVTAPAHQESERAMPETLGVSATWLRRQPRWMQCQKGEKGTRASWNWSFEEVDRDYRRAMSQSLENVEKGCTGDRECKQTRPRESMGRRQLRLIEKRNPRDVVWFVE